MRRAILHIGTEKTGTTTLQAAFAANRPGLLAAGVAYPAAPGAANHTGLAAYASHQPRSEKLLAPFARRLPGAEPRVALGEAIARELDALPASIHTVVFSGEHCHSHLTTEAEVARLHALLAPHFDAIEVVVYLRRQLDMAVSLYSTLLRLGGTRGTVLPALRGPQPYYDLEGLLARWGAVFGAPALRPRLYAAGGVLEDFLAVSGLDPALLARRPPDQNTSLDARAQGILRGFNLLAVEAPVAPATRLALVRLLEARFPGRGARPARRDAEAFQARFAEANERLRARWFPERAALFDEGFDGFEEAAIPPAFRREDALLALRLSLERPPASP